MAILTVRPHRTVGVTSQEALPSGNLAHFSEPRGQMEGRSQTRGARSTRWDSRFSNVCSTLKRPDPVEAAYPLCRKIRGQERAGLDRLLCLDVRRPAQWLLATSPASIARCWRGTPSRSFVTPPPARVLHLMDLMASCQVRQPRGAPLWLREGILAFGARSGRAWQSRAWQAAAPRPIQAKWRLWRAAVACC